MERLSESEHARIAEISNAALRKVKKQLRFPCLHGHMHRTDEARERCEDRAH